MDESVLLDQLDFTQARIEEIEKQVINYNPDQKGYKELVDSYNKWIDRYNTLMDKVEHFDDVDIEERKLAFEMEKFKVQQELEQDKLNLETVKAQLEREKFAYSVESDKIGPKDIVDTSLKVGELGVKVAVPVIGLIGTVALAKIAYTNDLDLKLCNGRIWPSAKEMLKIATGKI